MMKCQECDKSASLHITELLDGKPVVYHVCEEHSRDLSELQSPGTVRTPFIAVFNDPKILETLQDRDAQNKVTAFVLPPLCLALADERPEVRVQAAFRLWTMGLHAESAIGALRDALKDEDESVRKVAQAAIVQIQSGNEWF